jgi:hypothetical protein
MWAWTLIWEGKKSNPNGGFSNLDHPNSTSKILKNGHFVFSTVLYI